MDSCLACIHSAEVKHRVELHELASPNGTGECAAGALLTDAKSDDLPNLESNTESLLASFISERAYDTMKQENQNQSNTIL